MLDPEHTLNGNLPEKPESGGGSSSGDDDGSLVGTNEKSPSLAIEPSGSQRLPRHKATGPRTELGKRRSSRNATKHGAFSKNFLLPGESPTGHKRLLAALREAHQPKGAQEELLVEDLAFILTRKRRLRLAEWAEIRKNREQFDWDQRNPQPKAPEKINYTLNSLDREALIQRISNPDVLRRCLQLLVDLRGQLESRGFNPEKDIVILEQIYGDRDPDLLCEDLYDCYETWFYTSKASQEEREREGYRSPEGCVKTVLEGIAAQIRRLKRYQKERASVETTRTQLEILSRGIPDAPLLDRLVRYETSLERSYDRFLSRLERLQQKRLGCPLQPRIEVEVK